MQQDDAPEADRKPIATNLQHEFHELRTNDTNSKFSGIRVIRGKKIRG
jgi:hypothetical protein